MLVRSGARWIAAFVLAGMLFISGPGQASAEPVAVVSAIADADATADAYSVVASEAEELIAAAAGSFDGGSDRNAKTAHQNHQLLDRIHKRLDEYNQAFSKVVSFDNEQAANRLVEDYLAAIIDMKEYYRVLAEDAEPTADHRHRFENLSNAVDAMMQYDDLFIGHAIPGMWLVLDSMHISKRDKWISLIPPDKRRKSLDARIESYKNRLQRALDVAQPTSLAGRAQALRWGLNRLDRSRFYITRETTDGFESVLVVLRDRDLLWNWDELESSEPSSNQNRTYHNKCDEFEITKYDGEKVRDMIAINVQLLNYYSSLLRNSRYALSVLEYGIWSVAPNSNQNQIVIEPKPNKIFVDVLEYHNNIVDSYNQTYVITWAPLNRGCPTSDPIRITDDPPFACGFSSPPGRIVMCP